VTRCLKQVFNSKIQISFQVAEMTIFSIIILCFWFSFAIMLIIVAFAPEYIEDESGNLVPKQKEKML
jgi:hypothetical protein